MKVGTSGIDANTTAADETATKDANSRGHANQGVCRPSALAAAVTAAALTPESKLEISSLVS